MSPVHLQQDLERQARGTTAAQQVAGLTEVCGRGGKLACLRLLEPELAKLRGAPPEDVTLLTDKRGLPRGCGAR
jgi:hypothetical protein